MGVLGVARRRRRPSGGHDEEGDGLDRDEQAQEVAAGVMRDLAPGREAAVLPMIMMKTGLNMIRTRSHSCGIAYWVGGP